MSAKLEQKIMELDVKDIINTFNDQALLKTHAVECTGYKIGPMNWTYFTCSRCSANGYHVGGNAGAMWSGELFQYKCSVDYTDDDVTLIF